MKKKQQQQQQLLKHAKHLTKAVHPTLYYKYSVDWVHFITTATKDTPARSFWSLLYRATHRILHKKCITASYPHHTTLISKALQKIIAFLVPPIIKKILKQ